MFIALLFLVALIVSAPAFIIDDGPVIQGFVAGFAATGLVIVARSLRPGEAGHLASLLRPFALIALFPALWTLFQVLPLGVEGMSHSVWQSAAEVLGHPIRGAISIDPGATVIALFHYQTTVAIVLFAAAVAIERRRAMWLLPALTIATAAIALMVISQRFGLFAFYSNANDTVVQSGASHCIAIGLILAIATGIQAHERRATRRKGSDSSWISTALTFGVSLCGFLLCLLALSLTATAQAIVAAIFGLVVLVAVVAARRLALGRWGGSAIAVTLVVVAVSTVTLQPAIRNTDLTIAFATNGQSANVSVTRRILADTGWAGSGAGTFSALIPFYRGVDDLSDDLAAPTAAAKIAVEMGRPMLWVVVIGSFGLVLLLAQAATRRGRDYVYAAAGASCLAELVILSFSGIGPFNTSVTAIVAVVLGSSFAQSKSRSLQ